MGKEWMIQLSRSDREAIKACGLTRARIVRTRGTDRLIEARDNSGVQFRGWWYDGEAAADIRWDTENRDGWPANLS